MGSEFANLTPQQQRVTLAALERCLANRISTSATIQFIYLKYAKGFTGITQEQGMYVAIEVAQKLQLPQIVFHDLPQKFFYFDFNGDGLISFREAKKLFWKTLRQRRASLSGRPYNSSDEVPFRTLDEGRFTVIRELGRGGQGVMYLATKDDGDQSMSWVFPANWFEACSPEGEDEKKYCIKFYSKKDVKGDGVSELLDEFHIMKDLKHKNVARTFEVFQDQDFLYMVNVPYFGGDLTKLAKKAYDRGVDMTEQWWRNIFKQCLAGVSYLHSEAQMHCDIKEPNVMIARDDDFRSPRVVLIDFGLAQNFAADKSGVTGTPGYIPPETWRESAWRPQGDTFSLGVVFFQLLTARVPGVAGSKVSGIFQQEAKTPEECAIITVTREAPWKEFPANMPLLKSLLIEMLCKDPQRRPRVAKVLHHDWFSSNSNAALPRAVLITLVSGSELTFYREALLNVLLEKFNLDELRAICSEMGAVANGSRYLASSAFISIFRRHGIARDIIQNFVARAEAANGTVDYFDLMEELLKDKELRNQQLIVDLFNEMDVNGDGHLPRNDVKEILQSAAFECHFDDIDDLMNSLDTNKNGLIEFEEFKRGILEDGRIAPRHIADQGIKPSRRHQPFALFSCAGNGNNEE